MDILVQLPDELQMNIIAISKNFSALFFQQAALKRKPFEFWSNVLGVPLKNIYDKQILEILLIRHSQATILGIRELFLKACKQGRLDMVRILLPYIDGEDHVNMPLRVALEAKHFDIAKELIAASKSIWPSTFNMVCTLGHLELAKLMLEKTDPTVDNNISIYSAALLGKREIVDFLLTVPKIAETSDRQVIENFLNL